MSDYTLSQALAVIKAKDEKIDRLRRGIPLPLGHWIDTLRNQRAALASSARELRGEADQMEARRERIGEIISAMEEWESEAAT